MHGRLFNTNNSHVLTLCMSGGYLIRYTLGTFLTLRHLFELFPLLSEWNHYHLE